MDSGYGGSSCNGDDPCERHCEANRKNSGNNGVDFCWRLQHHSIRFEDGVRTKELSGGLRAVNQMAESLEEQDAAGNHQPDFQ